jgi:hypothetical protein
MRRLAVLLLLFLACEARATNLDPPSSAQLCGRCHRSIFEAWNRSSHAQAMESRLFQDALELTEADFGSAARKTCLACHSPVSAETNDMALKAKVSWEGVTCDYCHSIRNVTLTGGNPKVDLAFTLVKSGPLKDASSQAHGTVYSEVHTSSLACAPCHEYRNALGFPVMTTYSEWKKSSFAGQGKECQACHMYAVAGDVVDPRIQRSRTAKINLHEMPGSRSVTQLTRTVKGKLNANRTGDELQVVVEVTNREAGHYVPTGSPMRKLVLELRVDAHNGQHFRESRTYERSVADEQGKRLAKEHFAFLKAATVLSDTRLAPGETKTEAFKFKIPANVRIQVQASLKYFYSPMARSGPEQEISFLTMRRLLLP